MRNAFPSRLKTIEDAPQPFRRSLREQLPASDSVELLVYGPPYRFGTSRAPGALLAITDGRWFVAVADEEGQTAAVVHQSDYANTLLVELTTILLYGCLKIDFAAAGVTQTVRMYFNTVMDHLYQRAAQLLLDKIDGVAAQPAVDHHRALPLIESLPLKFQNAILHATPEGERLLDVLHCRVVLGQKRLWFQRELAPEAVLSLTDRELMVISEEKTSSWLPRAREVKYGSIVTHCPLSRFAAFHLSRRENVATLTLKTHPAQGGETIEIDFPAEKEKEISALMEHAIARRGGGNAAETSIPIHSSNRPA